MPRSMWFRGHAPYELEPLNPDKQDSPTHSTSKPLTVEALGKPFPTPTLPGKTQLFRTPRTVRKPRIELLGLGNPHVTMPFYQENQRKTGSYAPSKPDVRFYIKN